MVSRQNGQIAGDLDRRYLSYHKGPIVEVRNIAVEVRNEDLSNDALFSIVHAFLKE